MKLVAMLLSLLVLTISSSASEIVQIIDGRKILLKDDGQFELLADHSTANEIMPEEMELPALEKGGESLVGHLVKVVGKMVVFEDSAIMRDISVPLGDAAVRIDLTYVSKSSKKSVQLKCLNPCVIAVVGKVGHVTGGVGVIATEVELP